MVDVKQFPGKAIPAHEHFFARICEASPAGLLVIDAHGQIRFANTRAVQILDVPAEVLVQRIGDAGRGWHFYDAHGHLLTSELTECQQVVQTGQAQYGVQRMVVHPDGTRVSLMMNVAPLRTLQGDIDGVVIAVEDITDRTRLEARLHHLAYYDPLTRLPNRQLLRSRLVHALTQETSTQSLLVVMLLDLDNFKSVNDTLGHHTGDALLCHVAERLQACAREQDTVSRWGGDEFIVLLPGVTVVQHAEMVARRLVTAFQDPFHVQSHTFEITPSIGIAVAPMDGDSEELLLCHADMAMYRAKAHGGNTYRCYSPEDHRGQTPGSPWLSPCASPAMP